MILGTRFGNRQIERRSGEWGTEHLIPWPSDTLTAATPEAAAGLPAIGAAIRLIAGTLSSLPLWVWQGGGAKKKKRDDSWQFSLFEFPNDETTAVNFRSDIFACIESRGNAFLLKGRMSVSGRVGALTLLDPTLMVVRRDRITLELIYEYHNATPPTRIKAEDMLHIRGFTLNGGLGGLSPVTQHRLAIGGQLAKQTFESNHYKNDARPGVALQFPNGITADQAREHVELWDSRHAGVDNRGKTAAVGGGAEIKTFELSLEDQQFVESQNFSVQEVERMFELPSGSLSPVEGLTSEQESLRLLKRLQPRMSRVESAFKTDPDLFGISSKLYPLFYVNELLRTDAVSMATVAKENVQSGIWLVDEARAQQGLPPLPNGAGQVPQITPVGGAPNPTPPKE